VVRSRARRVRGGGQRHGAGRSGALELSRLCLDTSAYSRFKSGHAQAVELIDAAEWVGLPAVALGELWAGFLLGTKLDRNAAELQAFLAHPSVEEIPVDGDVARAYAEIVVELRRAGTPLPTNDVWIAASAARFGATVLTFDGHFQSIRRVGSIILEPYPP
jgi:predicted nucleic acid-binding protein